MLDCSSMQGPDRMSRTADIIRADVFRRAKSRQSEPSQESIDLVKDLADMMTTNGVDVRAFLAQRMKLMLIMAMHALPEDEVDELILEILAVNKLPAAA